MASTSSPSKPPKETTSSAADDTPLPIPNLQQQQHRFVLGDERCAHLHQQSAQDLLAGIQKDEMGPYLATLLSDSTLSTTFHPLIPSDLLSQLQDKNATHLQHLSQTLTDAQENHGETEVSDALRAKAHYLAQIGDRQASVVAFEEAYEKQAGLGRKIDLRLALIRVGLFWSDHELVKEQCDKAQSLVESGGDWDRRNRLKVYRGVYALSVRKFKEGTESLLDALSTFTATELISYEEFVALTMIGSALTLSRQDLKKKVIESAEVIQVSPQRPHLLSLMTSLYECSYDKFFLALAEVEQQSLIPSRWLSVHTRWYVREMRVKGYAQLLDSYRSLELERIARSFGVTVGFIDQELSRFIAAGRLTCSIDRVSGIVETNRPDGKNAMYASIVKNGDGLLNAIQKLSRVVA